jgi:hypothetical protein
VFVPAVVVIVGSYAHYVPSTSWAANSAHAGKFAKSFFGKDEVYPQAPLLLSPLPPTVKPDIKMAETTWISM